MVFALFLDFKKLLLEKISCLNLFLFFKIVPSKNDFDFNFGFLEIISIFAYNFFFKKRKSIFQETMTLIWLCGNFHFLSWQKLWKIWKYFLHNRILKIIFYNLPCNYQKTMKISILNSIIGIEDIAVFYIVN